ncbi:uncharacterized protein BX664DRAFT_277778 [Halteromyces radiatus]|uniref:uncharacterized protein n=1 Tax=Halteromyces radiatus TaxID=101107 RepID=UPI00221FBC47|nr:uncharacterized protein BX664DRAFT_277778 [Halteromyces radiatus]KAI8093076.1 hypothetical protein BX664DRAFT_277778 [Halteromyces radiatus]
MLFTRYRKPKKLEDVPTKKSSLADAFFRKLPFTKRTRSKTSLLSTDLISMPRHSTSLPNIVIDKPSPSSPRILAIGLPSSSTSTLPSTPTKTTTTTKTTNRQPGLDRLSNIINDHSTNRQRHSYTFGNSRKQKTTTENLSLKDLVLDPSQEKKLDLFLAKRQPHSPPATSTLSTITPTLIVPQRSTSHQLLSPPKKLLIRAHSTSSSSIHQQEDTTQYHHSPLDSSTLRKMLEARKHHQHNIMLVDVRNLVDYQKQRIRGSLNVNLPSLLIKRYQRGTVSNFHLENFITTAEGREQYLNQRHTSTTWVVYDDDMNEQCKSTQAWTLLNVLSKATSDTNDKVLYLLGGFSEFINSTHSQQWIEGTGDDMMMVFVDHDNNLHQNDSKGRPGLSTSTSSGTPSLQQKLRNKVSPRRSLSYTIGDGSKIQQQTSLFSLDTQAARENNANALARRASRRSQHLQQLQLTNQHSSGMNNGKDYTNNKEDDDILGQMTADISPRTETDFEFTISEIIPGFLYVGPEIETTDHADQLLARPIRRVLNMAEECHDRPLLQHHNNLVYRKIAARDTVEMRNIDHVMMEGVGFIEEAKRHHEPIYVHCKAGKSRSVTVILAYLVSCERWTLKQSYRHVIKARPNMSPNIGFIAELMKLENQVHGRVSSFMETDWHTASLPSPGFSQELKQLELAWQHSPSSPSRPPSSSPSSPVI